MNINTVYTVVGVRQFHRYEGADNRSLRIFRNFEDAEQYQFKLENEGSHDYVELTQIELN